MEAEDQDKPSDDGSGEKKDDGGKKPNGDDEGSDVFSSEEWMAIELHKWFLSEKTGWDVGQEFAIRDWKEKHQKAWREHRRKKHLQQIEREKKEIQDHRWIQSEKAGKDLGQKAEEHWVDEYAEAWRLKAKDGHDEPPCTEHVHREHDPVKYPPETQFRRVLVVNDLGLHVRPSMAVKRVVDQYGDHQVYAENLSREDSRPAQIREMCDILDLVATCGDSLEFGAVGPKAKELLEAIAALFASRFGEKS